MVTKKQVLLASTLLSGVLAFAVPAFAQQIAPPIATIQTPPTPAEGDGTAVSDLVITGTRLRLPDYSSPNPVVSVGEQQIQRSGEANITDFLTDIPSLIGSTNDVTTADQTTPFNVGLNLLNLRNLGSVRTLVLVNGRRHVAGDPGSMAVDVNTIPADLIQRVDILTGGASAVYGADGVSGVVNFVLKEDFDGLTTNTQVGLSQEGGGETYSASVLYGKNFAAGRGNFTVNAEYYDRKDVKFTQRSYTRPGNRFIPVNNPAEAANPKFNDPNIYDLILTNDARYIDTSPGGSIITSGDLSTFSFVGDGSPFIYGPNTNSFITIGGSGSRLDDYNDDLYPGMEKYSFNATGRFDLTDKIRLFGEAKYATSNSDFEGQPSYDYGLFIPLDNPFIPTAARNEALALIATGDDVSTELRSPDFGLTVPDGILVARDNFDLGRIYQTNKRETLRAVLGAKGDITPNLAYEVSAVYGQSTQKLSTANVRINDRFFAAIDAVQVSPGVYKCRSDTNGGLAPVGDIFAQFVLSPGTFGTTFTPGANSGCLPINIFGTNKASQAAIDWINTTVTDEGKITQAVANAFVSGSTESWFKVPTGGPVSFVLGGEYRKETSSFTPDALRLQAASLHYPVTFLGEAAITKGEFNVAEAFTELSVPILLNKPWAKELTLTGAYRYSDYSTSGGNSTYNGGLRWQINDAVMLRGTAARAVRAPNISDLFSGNQQTFESFADPCDDDNRVLGQTPTTRAANCAAAISAITPGNSSYVDTSSEAIAGVISGNANLKPEEATTVTYGVVFTPKSVRGLQMSLDYYDIRIADAITSYSAQTIINNCYDLPQPNQFCALLTRQSATDPFPGRIKSFIQVPGNISSYRTTGFDFTIRYAFDPSIVGITKDVGDFEFSLIGNNLKQLVFVQSVGAPPTPSAGNLGAPFWTGKFDTTWNYHNLSATYSFNYFGETRRYSLATQLARSSYIDPQYFKYGARNEHDLQVDYKFREGKYQVYGGINNFTNQKPEFSSFDYPVSPLGRFFYVGLRAKLK